MPTRGKRHSRTRLFRATGAAALAAAALLTGSVALPQAQEPSEADLA